MLTALLLGLSTFLLYLATWHAQFGGYEKETADAALAMLRGQYEVRRAGIGAALLYVPFAAITAVLSQGQQYFWLTLVPIFYSSLSVVVVFLGLHEYTQKRRVSVIVASMVAVGSMLWPYSNLGMEYQATLALALLFYALVYWRRHLSSLLWIGFAYLLLTSVKSYGILIGLPIIFFVWATMREQGKGKNFFTPRVLGSLIGPAILGFFFTILCNIFFYHSLGGAYHLANEFQVQSWWEGFYGIFFSIGKSIFLYNPLLIIAFFYSGEWYRRDRAMSVFVFGVLAILLAITAPFSYWSDETWGVRKLVPIIPLLHIPLIYFFEKSQGRIVRGVNIVILLCAVYVQILGGTYAYNKHLHILRELNLDSLTTMRYIPALAQTSLYHHLFLSYLHVEPVVFTYADTTWFRWLRAGDHDIDLVHRSIDLRPYATPDNIWLSRPTRLKQVFFGGILVLFLGSSWQLYRVVKREE